MKRRVYPPIYLLIGIIVSIVLHFLLPIGRFIPFLLVPLFMWLIQRNFIVHEEAMLDETFGEEYRLYKQKVRRWL